MALAAFGAVKKKAPDHLEIGGFLFGFVLLHLRGTCFTLNG